MSFEGVTETTSTDNKTPKTITIPYSEYDMLYSRLFTVDLAKPAIGFLVTMLANNGYDPIANDMAGLSWILQLIDEQLQGQPDKAERGKSNNP